MICQKQKRDFGEANLTIGAQNLTLLARLQRHMSSDLLIDGIAALLVVIGAMVIQTQQSATGIAALLRGIGCCYCGFSFLIAGLTPSRGLVVWCDVLLLLAYQSGSLS